MKRLCLYLVVLLGGFLLVGAPGCSSDPNVEGAKLDLRNKDYDRALENVAKALETNPDNAEAHQLKGQILQEQAFTVNDAEQHGVLLDEMVASYNRAVELDPAQRATVDNQLKLAYFNEFNRGIQAFNRGQQAEDDARAAVFNEAASYFGNAAMMFPDSSDAYINQAYAYFSSGTPERAIEPFEMAIEKGDTDEDTFIYLADLYRQTEQAGKGITLMERARQVYPENEDIQAQLMNFYVSSGRASEALEVYQEAVAKDPNNKLYRYNYGSLLLELENYDEAIEQLQAAVDLDPAYANAQYNLGAAYVNRAVAVNEQVTALDDELREKRAGMSEDEIKQMETKMDALAQERRSFFESAIGPLEKAKQMTEAEGGDSASLQGICAALFQSYVQTNQTEKAEGVSECAGYELN
jgi:tetratricopeptide (TPR) repeat protein